MPEIGNKYRRNEKREVEKKNDKQNILIDFDLVIKFENKQISIII
jgi:hypothetical protein